MMLGACGRRLWTERKVALSVGLFSRFVQIRARKASPTWAACATGGCKCHRALSLSYAVGSCSSTRAVVCGLGHRCLSYLLGHREQAYRTHAWHFQPCGCFQLGLATTSLGCFCAQLCKILNRGPAEIRGRSRLRRRGLKSGILSADVGLARERRWP